MKKTKYSQIKARTVINISVRALSFTTAISTKPYVFTS